MRAAFRLLLNPAVFLLLLALAVLGLYQLPRTESRILELIAITAILISLPVFMIVVRRMPLPPPPPPEPKHETPARTTTPPAESSPQPKPLMPARFVRFIFRTDAEGYLDYTNRRYGEETEQGAIFEAYRRLYEQKYQCPNCGRKHTDAVVKLSTPRDPQPQELICPACATPPPPPFKSEPPTWWYVKVGWFLTQVAPCITDPTTCRRAKPS